MTPQLALPPGATLVPGGPAPPTAPGSNTGGMNLPPGATLVQDGNAPPQGPSVTPGASDEQLIRSFGFDPKVIQSSPRYQQMLKDHGSGVSFMLTNPAEHPQLQAWRNAPVVGQAEDVGQGTYDVLSGMVQLARHGAGKLGMLSDADVQYGDLLDRVRNQDYLQNVRQGKASGAARLLGNMLVPLPGPAKAEGFAGAVAKGAVHGAEAGAVQPVLTGEPDNYLGEKTGQMAAGAAVGAGIGTVVGAAKLARNYRNTSLPENAAAGLAKSLQTGIEETPWSSLDDVEKAAAGGDKQAGQVLDLIKNSGDTPSRIRQASVNLQNYRTAQTATDLYGKLEQLVDQSKLGPAPLPETARILKIADLQAQQGMKDRGLIGSLRDIRAAITPAAPAAPPPSGLLDAAGNPIISAAVAPPAPQAAYGTARKVISQLDDLIRTGRTGDNALISDRGIAQLQQIKNALENDVSSFVQNSKNPGIQQAQQLADQYYRQVRVPFKDAGIAKAGSTTEPDTTFQNMIKSGRGDRAQKYYDALDPKGQSAVQYEMVNDAINKATDPVKGFSSARFVRQMDGLKDAYGVFFKGQDAMAVQGLRNLVLQAAKVDVNPAAAFGDKAGTAISALPRADKVLKFVMSTPGGRQFLYMAAGVKPGTRVAEDFLGKVQAAASRAFTAPRETTVPSPTQPAAESKKSQGMAPSIAAQ